MAFKNDDNLKQLELKLNMKSEEAEEVLALLDKYNKYTGKFKKKINGIMRDKGFEVLTGIKIVKANGEQLNGTDN